MFDSYVQAMVDTFLQEYKLDNFVHLEMTLSMLRMTMAPRLYKSTYCQR